MHGGEQLAASSLCDSTRSPVAVVVVSREQSCSCAVRFRSSPASREFLDPVLRALGPQLLVALRQHDGLLVPQDEAEEGHRDQAEAEHDPNVIVNVVHREADAVSGGACLPTLSRSIGGRGWVHVHRT